jgi:type VI protein secretion system component VasK
MSVRGSTMQGPTTQARQVALDYKAALEKVAQEQEGLASDLAMLADELERQGQPETACLLKQASHHHRASSIRSRAIAASGAYG